MTPAHLPGAMERLRHAIADDYAEPLAGMIRRGEIEPPDELVIVDAPRAALSPQKPDPASTPPDLPNPPRRAAKPRQEGS